MDDFAFRKGATYGSLICDLQTHRPVAVLPDRLPETVTSWLKQHSNIEVVSRDGYNGFRQGISGASSSIIQVYDRWHLIKNVKDQLDRYLTVSVPASIIWSSPDLSPEQELTPLEVTMTNQEKEMHERNMKKWAFIQEIQAAHRAGQSVRSLAKVYKLHRHTIGKYVRLTSPPSFTRHSVHPIHSYFDVISYLENEKYTVKSIDAALRKQGYTGTYSAVSRQVAAIRKNKKLNQPQKNSIHQTSRKQLGRWMWKMRNMLNPENLSVLDHCLNKYPNLKGIYQTIQEYRTIIQTFDYPTFLQWMRTLLANHKHPFHQYARRLRSDLEAIKHAFLLPYSNGLLEGQVNRLKTLKRMMYGRANLPLLQKRILYQL
ncbi:ISL3 family transposase [Bacillus cereus]|uniref:ISL3 family transposase n=1 Tax=Bacillus cereus TaxID=1396 RepID=UPI003B681BB7